MKIYFAGIKFLFLSFLLLWPSLSQAISVQAYDGKLNNAVGSIMQQKLMSTTTPASNDAFNSTIQGMSDSYSRAGRSAVSTKAAAGIVLTGGLAALLAPEALVATAVLAAFGTAVSMGIQGTVNWLWPDATHPNDAQLSGTGMPTGDPTNFPLIPSSSIAILDNYGAPSDIWFKNGAANSARHIRTVHINCPGSTLYCAAASGTNTSVLSTNYNITGDFSAIMTGALPGPGYYSRAYYRSVSGAPVGFQAYEILYDYFPPSGVTLMPPAYVSVYKPISQAVQDIPTSVATQPLSDAMLAQIVNAIWQGVDTSAYPNAVPYSAGNPITPSDISSWRAANPGLVPTIQDFVNPPAPPGATSITIPNPVTQGPALSVPGTTPIQTTTTVDFGNFAAPTMDLTPPTAGSILDPIFNLWPAWANFAFPPHAAVCPSPTIPLHLVTPQWGDRQFTELCTWMEIIRPTIQAVFAMVWSIAIVLIVMGA